MGKFWDTVSRLFKKDDEEKQNNSAGNSTSAASAYGQQATQQTQQPAYKDNTVIKNTENGRGLYQYNTGSKKYTDDLRTAKDYETQYNIAKSLGYDHNQAINLINNGTRWKDVALGENNRPIVTYKSDVSLNDDEEIGRQISYAMKDGLSEDQAINELLNGTRWKEQAAELWEDEGYQKQTQNRGFLSKAAEFLASAAAPASEEEARKRYGDSRFEKLKERRENKLSTKEEDNFWGQIRANFTAGDLGQQASILMGLGVMTGDQEQIERAKELQAQLEEYSQLNQAALDNENQILPWLSKDMAQYAPQLLRQTATSALPTAANLLLTGGSKMNVGQAIGSGVYSYVTMTGSAYNDLTDLGADPVDAARMAKDEALISGFIESFDTYKDFTVGVGRSLGLLGKTEEKIMTSFGKTLGKEIWEWAKNVESEGREEFIQELVSMANERRLADGHTDGGVGELLAYLGYEIYQQAPDLYKALTSGEKTDDVTRLFESWRGGAVIGGVMGLGGSVLNVARDAATSKQITQTLDNVVAHGDQQTLSQLSDEELARTIQQAEALNRQDAVDVLEAEQTRRVEAETAEVKLQDNAQPGSDYVAEEDPDSDFYEAPESQRTVEEMQTEAEEELSDNMQDILAFRRIARNGLQAIPTDMLRQYYSLVGNEIEAYEQLEQRTGNDYGAEIEELEQERENILKEGQGRQDSVQAQKEQAKVEESKPKAENAVAAEEQKGYNGIAPDEGKNIDEVSTTGPNAISRKEGTATNDSNRRNGNDDQRGAGRRPGRVYDNKNVSEHAEEVQGKKQEQRSRPELNQENDQKRAPGSNELDSRNLEVQQGDGRNGAVQQSVSEKVNGRGERRSEQDRERVKVKRRVEALEKHFLGDAAIHNVRKNLDKGNFAKVRDFGAKALSKIFGDKTEQLISKYSKEWVELQGAEVYGSLFESYNLTAEETQAVYNAIAVQKLLIKTLNGNLDTKAVGIMLDMSEEDVRKLLKGSNKAIYDSMIEAGILDNDLNAKGFRAKIARIKASQSGAGNVIANVGTNGARVGKADAINYNLEYKASPNDTYIEYLSDNEYKTYKRGEDYILVNSQGLEVGRSPNSDAILSFIHNSSAVYLSGEFSIFDDKFMRIKKTGEVVFDTEKAFGVNGRDHMTLRQNSKLSDLLNITYRSNKDNGNATIGTTKWITVNFSLTDQAAEKYSINDIEMLLDSLIEDDTRNPLVRNEDKAIKSKGGLGKNYKFFGPTANGAKKGDFIFIEADEYDRIRKASISGLDPAEMKAMSPAKYLTARTTIATPSNPDTGVSMSEVLILPDVHVWQESVNRRFVNTGEYATREELIAQMAPMKKKLMRDKGMSSKAADAEVLKYVNSLIKDNKVGSLINIVGDMLKNTTDGCAMVWGTDKGDSFQFRGPGGLKGHAIQVNFQSLFGENVPFGHTVRYYDGNGDPFGGMRYVSRDVGVEVMDAWGKWQPIKGKKGIFFESTYKFTNQFASQEDFWKANGEEQLRSMPRENTYGANPDAGMLKGYITRNVAQYMRGQLGFSQETLERVYAESVVDLINNIENDKEAKAQLRGVDLNSPTPPKTSDNIALLIWQEHKAGRDFFETSTGREVLDEEYQKIIDDFKAGKWAFKKGTAFAGWIDPDIAGLFNAMSAIDQVAVNADESVFTPNGGLHIKIRDKDGNVTSEYNGLDVGEITSKNVKPGQTAIGRNPSTYAAGVQIRTNVQNEAIQYMYDHYGLDPNNIYLSVRDVLEKYLDGDFDGDTAFIFQNAAADVIAECRKADKDKGYIDFPHIKGVPKDIAKSSVLAAAGRLYIEGSMYHNIGTYDNMLERMYSIPMEYYDKAAEAKGMGKNAGQQLLSEMEASFTAAYVLSIDFSKTGLGFDEFNNVVKAFNQEVYAIAAANGVINPQGLVDNPKYAFKPTDLIPSTFAGSRNANKRNAAYEAEQERKAAKKTGYDLKNTSSGSTFLYKAKERAPKDVDEFFGREADRVEEFDKAAYRKEQDQVMRMLHSVMTVDPSKYQGIDKRTIQAIRSKYSEIMRMQAFEGESEDKLLERKRRAICNEFFGKLGTRLNMNTQQVTDLLLYTLAQRGTSFRMLTNLNQRKYMKGFKGLTTAEIVNRNIRLKNTAEYLTNYSRDLDRSIKKMNRALENANAALDKATQDYIASGKASPAKQAILMRSGASVQQMIGRINELGKQIDALKKGKKKQQHITGRNINEYNLAVRNIRAEMQELARDINVEAKHEGTNTSLLDRALIENDELKADIAETLKPAQEAIDKAYLETESLADALNYLHDVFNEQQQQLKSLSESENAKYFRDATTGLEGDVEKELERALFGKPLSRSRVATDEEIEALRQRATQSYAEERNEVNASENDSGNRDRGRQEPSDVRDTGTAGESRETAPAEEQPTPNKQTAKTEQVKVSENIKKAVETLFTEVSDEELEAEAEKPKKPVSLHLRKDNQGRYLLTGSKASDKVFYAESAEAKTAKVGRKNYKLGTAEIYSEKENVRVQLEEGGRIYSEYELPTKVLATKNALRRIGINVEFTNSDLFSTRESDGKMQKNVGMIFMSDKGTISEEPSTIIINLDNAKGRIALRHEVIHWLASRYISNNGGAAGLSLFLDNAKTLIEGYDDLGDYSSFHISGDITAEQYKAALAKLNRLYGFGLKAKDLQLLSSFEKDSGKYDNADGALNLLQELFAQIASGDNVYGIFADVKEGRIGYDYRIMSNYGYQYSKGLLNALMNTGEDAMARESSFAAKRAFRGDLGTFYMREDEESARFGDRQESVTANVKKLDNFAKNYSARVHANGSDKTANSIAYMLSEMSEAATRMMDGKGTPRDVLFAYQNLKETQYFDNDKNSALSQSMEELRNAIRDASDNSREMDIEEAREHLGEAVDNALAAFIQRAKNVERNAKNSAKFEKESQKVTPQQSIVGKAWKGFERWQISGANALRALSGFDQKSSLYNLADKIDGARGVEATKQKLHVEAFNIMHKVSQMPNFNKLMTGDIKCKLDIGNGFINEEITALEAINLYREIKTWSATHGNRLDGIRKFTLDSGKEISLTEFVEQDKGGHNKPYARDVMVAIEDFINDKDTPAVVKAYFKSCSELFAYFSPKAEKVFRSINGFAPTMYSPDIYSPLSYGKQDPNKENFDAVEATYINSPRYMMERNENTGRANLHVSPMNLVVEKYIKSMSDYVAYAEFRNDLSIMNQNSELRTTKTLAQMAGEHLGGSYAKFFNNYIEDLTVNTPKEESAIGWLRQKMQKGILVGSPTVMIKQAASYFNAAGIIDMKYLIEALPQAITARGAVNEKSAFGVEYRRITGNFDPTLSEVFDSKAKKNPVYNWLLNGISKIDHAAVRGVWIAACKQVEAEGINRNSPEFDAAVTDKFTRAVMQTQPQFATALRPENARSDSELIKATSMFRTQQTQNFNRLIRTIGEFSANKSDENRKALHETLKGSVASLAALTIATQVGKALLHKLSGYRDRNDKDKDGDKTEITAGNVAKRAALDYIEAAAGTVWFGDAVAKQAIDLMSGGKTKEFYGVSLGPISAVMDTISAFNDCLEKPSAYNIKKFIGYAAQDLGIPANNLYAYLNAAYMYILDETGENPDKYDDALKYLDNYLKADNKMIRAITSGNEAKTNELWKELKKQKGDKADDQMRTLVKDQYSKGKLKNEQAENLLIKYGELTKENEAAKRVAKWEFDKAHPEYKDDVTEANVWKWKQTIEPTGVSLKTYVDALKHFKEISKDKENGNDRNDMLVYLSKLGLTENQMLAMYSSFGQNFYQSFDPTQGAYAKYNQYGKPAGISTEDFVKYYEHFNSLTSDKDKNGKTINNSKKKKVIAYINSLSLSKEQKRALWKAFGYTSKSPW